MTLATPGAEQPTRGNPSIHDNTTTTASIPQVRNDDGLKHNDAKAGSLTTSPISTQSPQEEGAETGHVSHDKDASSNKENGVLLRRGISTTAMHGAFYETQDHPPVPALPPRPKSIEYLNRSTPSPVLPSSSFSKSPALSTPPRLPPRPSVSATHRARAKSINNTDMTAGFKETMEPPSSTFKAKGGHFAEDMPRRRKNKMDVLNSTLANTRSRSKSISDVPTSSNSGSRHKKHHHRRKSPPLAPSGRSHAMAVYPDYTQVDRKPPFGGGHQRYIAANHPAGVIRAVAASRDRIATACYSVKLWDAAGQNTGCIKHGDGLSPHDHSSLGDTTTNAASQELMMAITMQERINCLTFAPGMRYLWAGLEDGRILVMDTVKPRIVHELRMHEHGIVFILSVAQELWTLDESGAMIRWPWDTRSGVAADVGEEEDEENEDDEAIRARLMHDGYVHQVTPRTVAAAVITAEDWHSLWLTSKSGRTLDVYKFPTAQSSSPKHTIVCPSRIATIPNDLRDITHMVTLQPQPGQAARLVCGHDDGYVTIWNADTLVLEHVVRVSVYEVTAMLLTGENRLWIAFKTGVIHIYDIQQTPWKALKMWEAHSGPIIKFVLECDAECKGIRVISTDSHGHIAIWDGLLLATWEDQRVEKLMLENSAYRDTRVHICSWNIDARSPDQLTVTDKEKVAEWLGAGADRDPDILAIGLQEIVDLESKRQTARSFYMSRRKQDKQEAHEELQLKEQYGAWRGYFTETVAAAYGDVYTLVKTEHLVGLYSLVFVKSALAVREVQSTTVKTGLRVMNKSLHGNKGGIAIRLLLEDASFCFVNCHLAAGQSHVRQRNLDAETILRTAKFPPLSGQDVRTMRGGGDGTYILDHAHTFFSGDLNYRLDHWSKQDVVQCLRDQTEVSGKRMMYRHLIAEDQLQKQRQDHPLLNMLTLFDELEIQFDPTYKYNRGTDAYDTSVKQRVPAWCDRILHRSIAQAENTLYRRHEVLASDHRPIAASFDLRTVSKIVIPPA